MNRPLRGKVSTTFDHRLHVFRSARLRRVVDGAIGFFVKTPVHTLPPPRSFVGGGVYVLYYLGDYELYAKLSELNRETYDQPIYVGKAVPPGWRAARVRTTQAPVLYSRLRQHANSIRQAQGLRVDHFGCRFMILQSAEADLVIPVEAELIRRHRPLWNTVVDGFGNHDPGSGRYNQAKSDWDVLHPGRPWADRLTGDSPRAADVIGKVKDSFKGSALP